MLGIAEWMRESEHMPSEHPPLVMTGVNKSYGDVRAVQSLDLTVPAGSIFGLLGPNGAGKTTTIRMALGIIAPDSGDVSLLGSTVDTKALEGVGYLPEERGLYRKMKVLEMLVFLAAIKGVKAADAQKRAREWLKRLGLEDWGERKSQELSRGMQQKVQFVATVLHQPRLLVLDEPFAGLDPVNVKLLQEIIVELRDQGATVILSTHMLERSEKLCEHVCLISGGRKVLDGALRDVKASYGSSRVFLDFRGSASFLETSASVASYRGYPNHAEVELRPEVSANQFLEEVLRHVEISRFEQREPSLEDIFLRTVGEPVSEGGHE
jgi:ABC-2 type transport system ATP-binding protein